MIVMVDISKHSKYTTLKIYVPLFIAGVDKLAASLHANI